MHSLRAGFTLTEALIAGAMAAIALTVVARAMILSQRSATMAHRHMAAVHAARVVLEDLTKNNFYDAALAVGRRTLTNGYYDVTLQDSRTKDVEVRVFWLSPRGATNWVVLTTSISSAIHF